MALLDRQAHALLDRNRSVWAAGLDQSAAAGDFRTAQLAAFTNLAGVPLSVWRYQLSAPVTDPQVLDAAAGRLAGRVVVLHVQLLYGLARVDPLPTSKAEYLTAVHRPAGWRLAGDADAATVGGRSWHGPWDFGPLVVRAGPHTLVLAHPDHAGQLAGFAALVDQSVPVVAGVWGSGWNEHVAVLIPDSGAEFQAVTGDADNISDIAAVAVADAVNPDLAASPDRAVLGARIVLNPANLSRLDAAGRRLVVQHELTHIATRAQTSDQMPSWLIEGFADYVGNLGSGRTPSQIAAELAADVRSGRVPARLPTDTDFAATNRQLPQVYEQAWLACRLIAARVGAPGLVRFYRQVSAAARTDPSDAAATGFRQVLGLTPAGFTAEWRTYLTRQLR